MIGLDTNVLVRYLTQDDEEQATRASHLIETRCTRKTPGRIAVVVLCELVWVLRGAYGYEKRLIVEVLDRILVTSELQVENEEVIGRALSAFRTGSADFADYVIVFSNQAAGCEATWSFDRRLVGHECTREL